MTTEKTAVALRVLMAYNQRQTPEEREVALLRAYCPEQRDWPADELACHVIDEMLKRKKEQHVNGEQKSTSA